MKKFYIGSAECYEFQCDDQLVLELLDDVKKCDYKKPAVANNNYVNIGYQKLGDHHVSYYNENLYKWLHECLGHVAESHAIKFNLKIIDLWPIKAQFGETSHNHRHVLSMFSGLLYLTSCNRSETIFECKEHFGKRWSFFLGEKMSPIQIIQKIKPEAGKLIIWPSDLYHKVGTHTGKEVRYTISFNTFIEGASDTNTARINVSVGNGYREEDKFLY